MNSFVALREFCAKEGLFHSKLERDTNNGKIITFQVRTGKSLGKGVIYSKTKWCPNNHTSTEKVLQLLAFDFFNEFGIPSVNTEFFGVGGAESTISITPKLKIAKHPERSVAPKPKSPVADLDLQIDQILDEEATPGTPGTPVMEGLSKIVDMMNGVKDKTPQGAFEAFSTPGGLQQIGGLLKDPNVANLIGPMMQMFSAPPGGAPQTPQGPPHPLFPGGMPPFMQMMMNIGSGVTDAEAEGERESEEASEVPLVHTPDTPEVVPE